MRPRKQEQWPASWLFLPGEDLVAIDHLCVYYCTTITVKVSDTNTYATQFIARRIYRPQEWSHVSSLHNYICCFGSASV